MAIPRVGDLCHMEGYDVLEPYNNQLVKITGCIRPRMVILENGNRAVRMVAKVTMVKDSTQNLACGIGDLKVLIPAEIPSGEQKVLDLFKRNDYDKEDLV